MRVLLVGLLLVVACAGQELAPTDPLSVPATYRRPIGSDSTEMIVELIGTPSGMAELGVSRGFVVPQRFHLDGQGLAVVRWRYPNVVGEEEATLSDCSAGPCLTIVVAR